MRALGVLLLCALAACTRKEPEPEPAQATIDRPHQALVAQHRNATLAKRLDVYRPLAKTLPLPGKGLEVDETLGTLVRELATAEDHAVLDALDKAVDGYRRKRVWAEVKRWRCGEAGTPLLKKWALAHPDSIELARYRPGGIAFLLKTVEDTTVEPYWRAKSVWELEDAGDRSVIERLRKLADDPTTVSLRSLRAGGGVPTLGKFVTECIEKLEAAR